MPVQVEQQQAAVVEEVDSKTRSLIEEILEQAEEKNLFGKSYTNEDAESLGIGTLGQLNLAKTMVKQLWNTPFIPKWMVGSQNPTGAFLATIMRGKELGFKMMESLAALYLSPDGRLGMYGTNMLALMWRSGFKIEFKTIMSGEKEIGMAVRGVRKDGGGEYTATFTTEDARRAGLIKAGGAHEKYPIIMCKWRAVSDVFRTLAADLAGGPVYTTEELLEEVMEETERRIDEVKNQQRNAGLHVAEIPVETKPEPVVEKSPDPDKTATPPKAEAAPAQTTAPEPAPEPARTKRTPKPASVETVSATPPAAQEAPRAEAAPTPAAPPVAAEPAKPAASKPSTQPSKLGEMITDLAGSIKELSVDAAKARIMDFLRGITNMPLKNPVSEAERESARNMWPWMIATLKEQRAKFINDPHTLAVDIRNGMAELDELVKDWTADNKGTAQTLAMEYYASSGGKDFTEFLRDVVGVADLTQDELMTFLWLCTRCFGTPHSNVPMQIKDLAKVNGTTMMEVVTGWAKTTPPPGKPMEAPAEWFAGFLATPAAPPVAATPAKADDDGGWDDL